MDIFFDFDLLEDKMANQSLLELMVEIKADINKRLLPIKETIEEVEGIVLIIIKPGLNTIQTINMGSVITEVSLLMEGFNIPSVMEKIIQKNNN